MSTNQNSEVGLPVLCTVSVGGTQVLDSTSLPDFEVIEEQQRPNLELRNLQEEAEYLYQDQQKIHQKVTSLENENEELKEQVVLLHGRLTTAEQEKLIEGIEYKKELEKKDQEIERLRQAVVAQSEECATLKQKQSENSTLLLKYESALKEYAKLETENKVLGAMVEDYKICKETNEQLHNENNDYANRCDEMTRALILVNEENRRLGEELQGLKALYDLKDEFYHHEFEKRKKLEKKLQILQGECETDLNQSKQRFTLRKSYLPECERCKSCLFENGVVNEECKYHPYKPLQYRSWIRMLPEGLTDGKSSKNLYWQCCKKFSTIEPEGCTSHPRHIIRSVLDPVSHHNS